MASRRKSHVPTIDSEIALHALSRESSQIDEPGLTKRLALTAFIACFVTWFPLGYTVTATNGPQNNIVNWIRFVHCRRLGGEFNLNATDSLRTFNETPSTVLWCKRILEKEQTNMLLENPELNTIWAVSSSMLCLGALFGTLTALVFVHYVGIKYTILLSTIILAAGSLLCAFSKLAASPDMFIVGRFVLGYAVGVMCVVTPVYMTEITPPKVRGALGTLPNFLSVIGLITAPIMGFPFILGNDDYWPYLIGLQLIPTILACAVLPFLPESPLHLYIFESKTEEARKALQWLRETENVDAEMRQMETEKDLKETNVNYWEFFRSPFLRRVFAFCAVPMLAQQFCGYYVVVFYSTSIFLSLGLDRVKATGASVGLWCASFLTCGISIFLVDRLGRKTLLATSITGLLLSLIVFVICISLSERGFETAKFGSAAVLPIYMGSFSFGCASIPWLLPGELFTQEARSTAACLNAAVSWGSALLATLLFPIIVAVAKQWTYVIFIICMVLALVFVIWKVPETKGKRIEDIQTELRNKWKLG